MRGILPVKKTKTSSINKPTTKEFRRVLPMPACVADDAINELRREYEAKSKSQEEPGRAKKNQGIEQPSEQSSEQSSEQPGEQPSEQPSEQPREQRKLN